MQNKIWNVSALLYNEELSSTPPSFDYSLNVEDVDGNTVNIWNPMGFYFLIITKFTSFCYLTPRFYDPESEQVIDVATNTIEALELFRATYSAWLGSRQPAIERLFQAFRADYNPIWNVDGVEGRIQQTTHTGTDTDKKTGDITKSGKSTTKNEGKTTTTDKGKTTTTNTGKSSNTKSGNETNEPTGQDVLTKSVTTYDDATFRDTEKDTTSFTTRKDTHTYNSVKDSYEVDSQSPLKEEYEVDSQNPLKSEYEVDSQNPLKETYEIDSQNPLKEKYNTELQKTLNLSDQDLEMTIRQGNIGIIKSQDLVMSEKDVRDMDDIINYAIYDFVHRNLVLR